jgi:hypothetical protein
MMKESKHDRYDENHNQKIDLEIEFKGLETQDNGGKVR